MKRGKRIAVDFDGTIHRYSQGWQGGKLYDPPQDGAIESIEKLWQEGYEVFIFTTRGHSEDEVAKIRDWLLQHNLKPDIASKIEITNIKKPALVYIDDRAIRFTNWNDTLKYFT